MARMTRKAASPERFAVAEDAVRALDSGYGGAAIDRLAAYEDLHEAILRDQEKIAQEMEALRQADRTKTVQFRELLARKLTNNNLLAMFSARRLEV